MAGRRRRALDAAHVHGGHRAVAAARRGARDDHAPGVLLGAAAPGAGASAARAARRGLRDGRGAAATVRRRLAVPDQGAHAARGAVWRLQRRGVGCRHRRHRVGSPAADARHGFRAAWPLVHGAAPHAPTFRLFDTTYGGDPMACDFVFVSAGLAAHVHSVQVDLQTRASDHQPVLVEFGNSAKD